MSASVQKTFDINVRDLIGHPGESRERELDVELADQWGEGLVHVNKGDSIHVDARLESLHDGILVTAQADTVAKGECGRCLDPMTLPVEVDITELFAYPSEEDFDYEVSNDAIDLESPLRDAVVLALPFQPVCRPDCPGLDPETGEKLETSADAQDARPVDARWAALADFPVSESNDEQGNPGSSGAS